jgi:serine/threonine protein phosphatase 1
LERGLPKSTGARKSRLPPGFRVYAIGDIHGCVSLLDWAFLSIDSDLARRPGIRAVHIFLGDYIDRGPASRQVLDRLIARSKTHECIFLKGNHETYLLDFLKDADTLFSWRQLGGYETLMSYGLKPPLKKDEFAAARLAKDFAAQLPADHVKFLKSLDLCFSFGDYFFVHAGVRPGVPLKKQREEDLLLIRDDFLLSEDTFGKVIVHGHTPVLQPEVYANRINIDTGAYATGRLTCLIIEDDHISFL